MLHMCMHMCMHMHMHMHMHITKKQTNKKPKKSHNTTNKVPVPALSPYRTRARARIRSHTQPRVLHNISGIGGERRAKCVASFLGLRGLLSWPPKF